MGNQPSGANGSNENGAASGTGGGGGVGVGGRDGTYGSQYLAQASSPSHPPGYNIPQNQQQIQQQQFPSAAHHPADDLLRSASDTSMSIMMDDVTTPQPIGVNTSSNNNNNMIENWLDDDTVPTVFRWEHGGRHVYITGTFNGWSRQIPMHRSGNDFTYIHNLKRGKHAFKFIVDDEWRFAPDQPTVCDIEGRINNFIDVTSFKAYTGDRNFEKEKAAAECGLSSTLNNSNTGATSTSTTDDEVFSRNMPEMDEYTKEPPPLPPHLRQIILNKPPHLHDTAALPVPQHVALNHLYCTAIRDNTMVLGITQRYKTKFVTTVYYSPCASS